MSPLEQPTGREVSTNPPSTPSQAHVSDLAVAERTGSVVATDAPASHSPASKDETEPQITTDKAPAADTSHDATARTNPPSTPPQVKSLQANDAEDALASSVATIKPAHGQPSSADTSAQLLSAAPPRYVDPTPPTPMTSQPSSRSPSNARSPISDDDNDRSPSRSDDDKRYTSEDDQDGGSRSEIQSIMDQFSEAGGGPDEDEVMSPRLEITSPMLGGALQHPPRKSSLEPVTPSLPADFNPLHISTAVSSSARSMNHADDDSGPPVPPKDDPRERPLRSDEERKSSVVVSPTSPTMPLTLHRPPPPEPEPEPSLPFDFHRFLEQLRNKKADPVARYLKSFLSEFAKKQWMVHEQVKIIGDFLAFIANKMMQSEVWMDVSDAEFDNAREGMEKLVMNRLYAQTFSPAISPPMPIPDAKPKKRGGPVPMGPGRRGQHQEDVERDDILTQKINIYGWVKEEHLDIPPVGESGRRFLKLAQQELLKIRSYRAPRDKIICVLNCSKVIFGLLKHNKSDSSADSFMPLLIHVVLQSNPEHLVSNVQYILRFRNQDKLGGEAGYYLSSLMGAIQFIESMDRSSLTISDDEFEKNVEAAVSAIAEKQQFKSPVISQQATMNEKVAVRPREPAGRSSMDGAEPSTPRYSISSNEGDSREDGAAITGLLRTFQKPLSTIGRIFSEETGSTSFGPGNPSHPMASSDQYPPRHGREARHDQQHDQRHEHRHNHRPDHGSRRQSVRHTLSAEEAAARQASAEAAEAHRLQNAEHANVVETLSGMFPDLDRDIISDVVYEKEGRVGLAVDACLALST
ncbi:hypothetical protein RJ55_02452 [Drechmeria coniospora]|nr:hypothetical protein RJ55_02452 [Drechmeria coniospora]